MLCDPGEFYAVGFRGEGAALITPDKTWYYTDSRYIEAARQLISGAEVILWTAGNGFREQIAALVKAHGVVKLGFEEEFMSVSSHTAWTKAVEAQFVPASELLTTLRQVKDAGELAAMREAPNPTPSPAPPSSKAASSSPWTLAAWSTATAPT